MDIYAGMVLAGLIFLASLISVELGISAAVVASAVFPTFLAQRFFHPHHLFESPGGEVDPELLESST